MIHIILGCLKKLFAAKILLIALASNAYASNGFGEVYSLLNMCMKYPVTKSSKLVRDIGVNVLVDNCRPIFIDVYKDQDKQSFEKFNIDWEASRGQTALTRAFSYRNLSEHEKRLSNKQSRIRDDLYEQLTPNWLGIRRTSKARETIGRWFDEISPIVYSQFTKCFSKMHENSRLVRELISKKNFLKTGVADLSEKQMFLMDKAIIFISNSDNCDTLEIAFDKVKSQIIYDFKEEAKDSNDVKRNCKSLIEMLNTSYIFNENDYPSNCVSHYQYNLNRIYPVARKIISDFNKDKQTRDVTSPEQLIN